MADSESQLIQELRGLAGNTKDDEFDLLHDGVPIRVKYTSGSSSSLTFAAAYDDVAHVVGGGDGYREASGLAAIRPMDIALRPETHVHRDAKAGGVDVEFQTGDAAFDRAVYVDTQTPADVLTRVLEADARSAVLDLFALDFTSVTIDDRDGRVITTMTTFASVKPAEPAGERAVAAFARLCRALPRIAKLGGAHALHPLSGTNTALAGAAVITFFGALPLYFGVTVSGRCPGEMTSAQSAACLGPGGIGLVCGFVIALLAGLCASGYSKRYRGRSDSSRHGAAFAGLTMIIAFALTATLVSILVARRQ